MKVLVIGTRDKKGGAAGISWALRKRLKADGHAVSTFVRYKDSDEPDVHVIPRHRWQDWLVKLFANDLWFGGSVLHTKEYKEADVIHCHNLHSNFFRFKDLIRMSAEKPVVWTIHDLWPITGFASDTATLKNPNKKRFLGFLWDNTSTLLKMKERVYEKSRLHIVAVSDWLAKMISASILDGHPVTRIYNGVDISIFTALDKNAMRKELGLPYGKKIVGFVKKGWIDAKKVIEKMSGRDDIFFVALDNPPFKDERLKKFPFTDDRNKIAGYMSCMDAFLYPTTGDTFGLIAAEAMACGVPVVAYAKDALSEIISHKETGYLARPEDIDDLKSGLEYILGLSESGAKDMGERARKRVLENFTEERMYREYLALYKRVISEKERQKTG